MLRRKKGHFLVTKTQRTKLLSDKPQWLNSTQLLFNQVIEFYVDIYALYPELASVPSEQVYSTIEPITVKTKNRDSVPHPLPYNCPMVFRRAAIKKARGMFKSWQTSYQSWQNKCDLKIKKAEQKGKKAKLPRPPLLPRKFNSPVTLYKGMYKDDIGGSIILKLWTGKSWAWVKHKYQDYQLSPEWIKSSPTLVIKNKIITLNWCYEKLVKSNGKVAEQIKKKGGLTVCSVDLNLEGDIAVCSILKVEGTGRVTEKKRLFIKGNKRHQHLRKRLLGRDAVAKSKTNSSVTLTSAKKTQIVTFK